MLPISFFTWWYGQGWVLQARNVQARLTRVVHLFSLPILIRTLFAPWRRIITYPGAGLEAKLRAFGDNLFSRMIGFVVRVMVLFGAAIVLLITAMLGIGFVFIWPLLPVLVPVFIVLGIIG